MSQRLFFSLILLFFAVLFADNCCSQSLSSDSITITTYYPSPYGAYKRLRLMPSEELDHPFCDQTMQGELFYDKTNKAVRVCQEDDTGNWSWSVLGSFSETERYKAEDFCITDEYGEEVCLSDVQKVSDSQMLVKAMHTVGDCRRAGGEVADSDVGLPLCKFISSNCPSGWSQYKNYSKTEGKTCQIMSLIPSGYKIPKGTINTLCPAVIVDGHSWSNTPVDSKPSYAICYSTECNTHSSYGGPCCTTHYSSHGGMCRYCDCPPCAATVLAIGCY